MRRLFLVVVANVAGAALHCRPQPTPSDAGDRDAMSRPGAVSSREMDRVPRAVESAGESFMTEAWSFPLDSFEVGLSDVHGASDLASALRTSNAAFVVNGGFFDRDGAPIGLAVADHRVLSPFSRSLSGGVLVVTEGRASLFDADAFNANTNASFAIQCRPRLVVDRRANVKSDDGHRAERTALCARDEGRVLEVVLARSAVGGPSLFAFARHLATDGCENALNLDGGPSTGAAWREASAVREERPRGPIRHAIVVKRRGAE